MHKLTAGSGYDYLTRQVAAMDSTEKGYTGLASYYTERGETPGVWIGTGCDAIRPGFAGSIVTAEQMQALFGAGTNPIGPELQRALGDASTRTELTFTRLNPTTHEWQTLSWGDEDAAFRQDLSDYLSADKIMLVGNA